MPTFVVLIQLENEIFIHARLLLLLLLLLLLPPALGSSQVYSLDNTLKR